jgi:hypothetical protein
MEREYISIEDITDSTQSFFTDFLIKGSFQITNVSRRLAKNGTPYYNIKLKSKFGNLRASRFTHGHIEFESLNFIYLVGNVIEIEGIYQYKWHSVKITSEKQNDSFIKTLHLNNPEEEGFNLQKENTPLLENQNDKLDELIKLYKFGTTIQIKSYINDMIKPIFNKASKKKIKEFEEFIEKQLETWPEDRRNEILEEFFRTLGRYKSIQPTKWRKLGLYLLKLISLLS